MSNDTDYKLANLEKKELKLRARRNDIIKSDGQTALSMILDDKSPATLVQSFPDQDLYYLMHKIGIHDFIPVLSIAASEQWEYILDVDVWQDDRLDVSAMTRMFDQLFQADPQRLLRWLIKDKPDYFEFYLLKNMEIKIREHDELPPSDFDDYITLDDKFYFRFPEKPRLTDDQMPVPGDNQEAWEVIESMIKSLAEMDLSVLHGLFLETSALLPAETEEEQFRLKTQRLAEKGFLPTHEAIGIYQPTETQAMKKRPEPIKTSHQTFDPSIPMPPQFFSGYLTGDNLFVKAAGLFDPPALLAIESELAALINKLISADRIRLRKKENLESVINKTCAYLNLGLEILLKDSFTPEHAKEIIENFFLEEIFRTGSSAGIKLKTQAIKWFQNSFMQKNALPLSFLGQDYLGRLGGLMLDRPMCYDPDNVIADTNQENNSEFYRHFFSSGDIIKAQTELDEIFALDTILEKIDIDTGSFVHGVLTYKTLLLTLWAKNRLDLEHNLEPISVNTFMPFFRDLLPGDTDKEEMKIRLNDLKMWIMEITDLGTGEIPAGFERILNNLVHELVDEYGTVTPEDIDSRFMPHFILEEH